MNLHDTRNNLINGEKDGVLEFRDSIFIDYSELVNGWFKRHNWMHLAIDHSVLLH